MPKVSPIQGNFNAGELSPLMYGRIDADKYKQGLATCLNYIPTIQGGLSRRPGTIYGGEAKYSNKFTRLEPFEFSTTQAYMLEIGDFYVRFWANNGIVTYPPKIITGVTNAFPCKITSASHGFSNGDRVLVSGVLGMAQIDNKEFIVALATSNDFAILDAQTSQSIESGSFDAYVSGGTVSKIFEVPTLYPHTDVFLLNFCQSDDVLYITIANQPPYKLQRLSALSWTLTVITFVDGPYLSTNTTGTTLTPSAGTGSSTITASAITGINNGAGFAATDVGRLIRFQNGTTWCYAHITAFTSSTVVTATVLSGNIGTSALVNWRLGLYSATTGYPICCTFHEARLFFAGAGGDPSRFDGSNTFDFENFTPTATDGTVASNHSLDFSLDSNEVNSIKWLNSNEKGLLIGTTGGEWFIRPATTDAGITPTNITAKQSTAFGSNNIPALKIGRNHIFVQRAQRKVRELSYNFYVDGFDAVDVTLLSEHITGTGIVQTTYASQPQSVVWAVRTDGVLVGLTYERDGQNIKAGWSRHELGGVSDLSGSPAFVESVGVIPTPTYDQLWVVVRRYINGLSRRYIEFFSPPFDQTYTQNQSFFLDAGLSYDSPILITGTTNAIHCVITALSHGFSNGDKVRIDGVLGMTELNGNIYTVADSAPNTFELLDIDSTDFGTFVSSGLGTTSSLVRKLVSNINGLNHLEGQIIQVLGDGAELESAPVSNGSITLSSPAATVTIGLGYNSDGQMLRLDAGAADGTAIGKTRRTHRVGFLLYRTLGFKFGMDFDEMDEITFRKQDEDMDGAVPLYSGIVSEVITADYDFENQICFRQNGPFPGTILAIMPQLVTQDRG